jgi:hypothetical protein
MRTVIGKGTTSSRAHNRAKNGTLQRVGFINVATALGRSRLIGTHFEVATRST